MGQSRGRTRARCVALACIVIVVALAGCDWPFIHGATGNSGKALDAGFAPSAVPSLRRIWRFHPGGAIEATPVTFHGIVYLAAGNGTLYALDTTRVVNGAPAILWHRDYGLVATTTCPGNPTGLVASPAVRDDGHGNPLVYSYTPQGTLQELDGRTGSVKWESRVYTIPNDGQNDYFSWASPIVANGLVYVGTSSTCDTPFVPSAEKAYDQDTGAVVGTYSTMPALPDPDYATRDPKPPSQNYVGAGAWTTSAADDGAYLYITTGSTYRSTNTAHPPLDGNDFDQYSMLKLDARTLRKVGKFAVPQPVSVGDPDWGSGVVLFEATLGGTTLQMAGACNKDGNFYAVRTDVMRAVWAVHVGYATAAGEIGCLSGGVWDGTHLYVAGNATTIGGTWTRTTMSSPSGYSWPLYTPSGGTQSAGSVRALDPATGLVASGSSVRPLWERGLPSNPLGACSINGASTILACQTTDWTDTFNAAMLLDPSNGNVLAQLHDTAEFAGFSTPIWADGALIVTDSDAVRAYRPS